MATRARPNAPKYNTKSFISMPLIARGETCGVLNLTDKKGKSIFNQSDLIILNELIKNASYYISEYLFDN